MPRIQPFRALRPTPDLAAQVASVPYDVVSRDEAVALAEGNPLSFLHVVRPEIDLPAETDPYCDAVYQTGRDNLTRLIRDGVLQQDEQPSVFVWRLEMDGRRQTGLVCCCHVDDYENNLILKHEKTRQAKEDDRTKHMLALNCHPGPVFLTCRAETTITERLAAVEPTEPLYDFTASDGVRHTVWRVEDARPLVEAFSAAPVFYVADGHHRAASAWRAGRARRDDNPQHTGDEDYSWFLTVLFPHTELRILAYNRVIRDLNGHSPEELRERLSEVGQLEPAATPVPDTPGSFCLLIGGEWLRLTIPPDAIPRNDAVGSLDVALLEDRILRPLFGITDVRTDPRIDFVGGIRGTAELERLVGSGAWAVAVSMYPTSIEQLMAVADAGAIMPPKSTWFEPKLRSGLFVHPMD